MENIRKRLSRYYWANVEVERQAKRKARLEKRAQKIVADSVKGSMIEYPYIERVVRIEGDQKHLLEQLENQINRSIEAGLQGKADAEDIIQQSDEPREREVLRSRFIDCLTWESVGEMNHIDPRHARRIVESFIKKVSS